jgi:hypothetical protein
MFQRNILPPSSVDIYLQVPKMLLSRKTTEHFHCCENLKSLIDVVCYKHFTENDITFVVFVTDAVCDRRSFDDCVTWSRWCFYG